MDSTNVRTDAAIQAFTQQAVEEAYKEAQAFKGQVEDMGKKMAVAAEFIAKLRDDRNGLKQMLEQVSKEKDLLIIREKDLGKENSRLQKEVEETGNKVKELEKLQKDVQELVGQSHWMSSF